MPPFFCSKDTTISTISKSCSADLWTYRSSRWFYLPPDPMQAGGVSVDLQSACDKFHWPKIEDTEIDPWKYCSNILKRHVNTRKNMSRLGELQPKEVIMVGRSWIVFFHQPSSLECGFPLFVFLSCKVYWSSLRGTMYRLSEPPHSTRLRQIQEAWKRVVDAILRWCHLPWKNGKLEGNHESLSFTWSADLFMSWKL